MRSRICAYRTFSLYGCQNLSDLFGRIFSTNNGKIAQPRPGNPDTHKCAGSGSDAKRTKAKVVGLFRDKEVDQGYIGHCTRHCTTYMASISRNKFLLKHRYSLNTWHAPRSEGEEHLYLNPNHQMPQPLSWPCGVAECFLPALDSSTDIHCIQDGPKATPYQSRLIAQRE